MNVPKLRFKEFGGEWETKSLCKIASKSIKKNKDESIKIVLTNSAVQGIVNQTDYFDKDIANQNNLAGYYIVHVDDFIYNPRISVHAPVGPIKRNHVGLGVMSPLYTVFRFSEGNKDFLEHFFETYFWHEYLQSVANTGARHDRMNISNEDFYNLPIPYPCMNEQTKIANFLTTIDERTNQLTRKKELMTQYKQGVMQQIFSQQLRFKDDNGEDFGDWEDKKLGDIAAFFRGQPLSKADLDIEGLYFCIHYGELFTIYNEIINTVHSKTNVTASFLCKSGDILMPSSDVTPSGLARASCLLQDKVVVGGDINLIRPNTNFDSVFLSYLLNFEKKKIMEFVSGTTVKHIYIKDLKKIQLITPTNKAEQTKIANFLTALDEKIQHITQQIEATKQYKQGLLQQMFV